MRNLLAAATLAASMLSAPAAQAANAMEIVGWKEMVRIPAFGIELATKNDTGAESASLHADNIEPFEKNGDEWVRFDAVVQERDDEDGLERKTIRYEAPVAGTVLIKRKGQESQRRYQIEMELCMGHIHRKAEVNLANRNGYSTRMLLGREFLYEAALVDPSRTFTRDPLCVGPVVEAEDH